MTLTLALTLAPNPNPNQARRGEMERVAAERAEAAWA